MTFDYSNLYGAIAKKGITQKELASKVGISHVALTEKLKNRSDFRNKEIWLIANVLELPNIEDYFFVVKPTKT